MKDAMLKCCVISGETYCNMQLTKPQSPTICLMKIKCDFFFLMNCMSHLTQAFTHNAVMEYAIVTLLSISAKFLSSHLSYKVLYYIIGCTQLLMFVISQLQTSN